MKSQKFRVVQNAFTTELKTGKIYTLTENGCSSTSYVFETYLNQEGDSLYEKWCKYWEDEIRRGVMTFELIEEEIEMEEQKIRVVENNVGGSVEKDLPKGEIFTLTKKGLADLSGYEWDVFLKHEGSTLFEKWCNYWKNYDSQKNLRFELVEDPKIELKLTSIEEGEKFYILDKDGRRVMGWGFTSFFITGGVLYDSNFNPIPNALSRILKGELVIQKEDPKIKLLELEIEKQEGVLRKLKERLPEYKREFL